MTAQTFTKKLFIVVNVDWFFLSHRLSLAIAARKAGYSVTIVACDTGKSREILSHGLEFIHVPFKRSGTNLLHELRCINRLREIYKLHRPDIVHHVTIKVSIYGSIAARLSGVRNVVNAISGLGYNFTSERKGLTQKILSNLMKLSFKSKSSRFIFQNHDDISVFKSLNLVDEIQITLIKGSGVDLNEFREVPPPRNPYITVLLPARILYDKGIIEYIQAAESLKDKFSGKVRFLIAGGFDAENLAHIQENLFTSMLRDGYIEWIGFKSDMVTTMGQADIIILPSYREGLPKALIEAAAIGRPIVTTNVPGCKECVVDGYNGFIVPAKNVVELAIAIESLVLDKNLRDRFGRNSRLLAEKEFSITKVLAQTLEIYSAF